MLTAAGSSGFSAAEPAKRPGGPRLKIGLDAYCFDPLLRENLKDPNKGAPTDLKKLVRIIRAGGYRGYIPIETLTIKGTPYDPRARATELLAGVRAALAQTA